jgi:AP-1 complex subunit beta-1
MPRPALCLYVIPTCCHQAAKDVVLANKPVITDDSSQLEPALLKALMEQISSLASVYHKPADTFVSRQRLAVQTVDTLAAARSFAEEDVATAAVAPQVGAAAS